MFSNIFLLTLPSSSLSSSDYTNRAFSTINMQMKIVLVFLVVVATTTAFRFNRNYRQKPRYNNNFMNAYLYSTMSGDMDMFDMPEFNYYNYMMSRFAGSQKMNAFSKYTLLKEMDYF